MYMYIYIYIIYLFVTPRPRSGHDFRHGGDREGRRPKVAPAGRCLWLFVSAGVRDTTEPHIYVSLHLQALL